MPDISEDFLWQFRHLDGDLLGERRKNLFKLLRKEKLFANDEQLTDTLKSVHPETHVENLFYVETLIYFKRTPELVEILKQGNEVYISKIFKHPWFFKEAFKDVEANGLVNEFLPHLSFAVRMKLLKWLSVHLSEAEIDDIFDCLLKRYGLRIASDILHACSPAKIVSILSNDDFEIRLKPNQVKILFDKDLPTFLYYMQYYKDIIGSLYNDESVFKHISSKNPTVLLKVRKNLCLFRLGRRTSKKLVEFAKDDIVKNIGDYTRIVNQSAMVRKLKSSFKNVYCDLFPRKINDLNSYSDCNRLLLFYPKKRRWELFTQTFSQIFVDKNILDVDVLSHFNDGLMKICTEREIIYRWAEIKYNKLNNNDYLKYFKPEKAFSMVKEKINVTSKYYDRQQLLKIMLDCCKENKDMDTLEKVLQYICARHRNEPSSFRQSLLNNVEYNFNVDSFSEAHWRYIKEILDVIRIEDQHYGKSLLTKYLHFLYRNNKPFKAVLKEVMNSRMIPRYYCKSFLLELNDPPVEKELIISMASMLPEVVDKDHEYFIPAYLQMIRDIVEFNENNKEYSIILSNFPHLVEYINEVLKGTKDIDGVVSNAVRYNTQFPDKTVVENSKLLEIIAADSLNTDFQFTDLVERMICKRKRSEFENQMVKRYFEDILDRHMCHDINVWFMRNEPSVINPYMEKIIAKFTDPDVVGRIYGEYYFRGIKHSRFNFESKLIDVFKKHLNNPECNKMQLVNHLFYLATTDELIQIVEQQFLPKKQKLDLEDEEMKENYETECYVANSLKKVIDPLKMFPVVFNFTVGDYLKSALPSLYSMFYRVPEKELYTRTDDLSKKAVSVKKHALFLSCELLNVQYTTNILQTTNKKNISSEKYRFSAILKYFVKNPSEELFDLLLSNIYVADKNDEETLKKLSTIRVSKKYQARYIEKCWQFFESVKKEIDVTVYLDSLLDVILTPSPELILQLSSEFCKHIISSYLTETEDVLCNIGRFTCHVLRYRKTEQLANFNSVFEINAKHKQSGCTDRINNFFENMYEVASEKRDADFIKLYDEHWNNLFTPIEKFYEFLLVKLLVLRCTTTEPFEENYARSVVTFSEDLVAQYDLFIFNCFKRALQKDFSNTGREKVLVFLYHVLKYNTTKLNCILVLDLMGYTSEDASKEITRIYKDILEILKSIDDPNVKLHYNLKFDKRDLLFD